MYIQTWADVVAGTLNNLWFGVLAFIPNFLGALIIFVIGLAAAASLGALVEKVFEALKLDVLLGKLGLAPYFDRAGIRMRGSWFLGQVVTWFLNIVFLLAASEILGKDNAFSAFLRDVLGYIPNIVVSVMVMLAAVVLGNFLRKIVVASVTASRLHAAHFLGTLTWWAVVIFGLLTALIQLNVAPQVINSLLTGFIAMIAIAGGLAFGLGGKEYAAHLLEKLQEQTEGK
ncbi:MAG TPA: hypothetical protein VMC43_01685 [Candidatus Paceibacterota bacterium]|nr:hypothetical protein [Candidatus Paceibacterota bacterium]